MNSTNYARQLQNDLKKQTPQYVERVNERAATYRDKLVKDDPNHHRRVSLKHKYGMTLETFNDMCSKQENKCLICGVEDFRLFVDHCHKTKRIRGLLCRGCNTGLGHFKESPDNLANAIEYLKNFA